MKLSIRNKSSNCIIDIFSQKIDNFLSKLLRKTLLDLIKSNNVNILINFTQVNSLDPTILGTIIAAHRTCKKYGGKISIYGLNPDLLLIFHIIQLDKYISLYQSEVDALNDCNHLTKRRLRVVK